MVFEEIDDATLLVEGWQWYGNLRKRSLGDDALGAALCAFAEAICKRCQQVIQESLIETITRTDRSDTSADRSVDAKIHLAAVCPDDADEDIVSLSHP